MTLKYYFLHIPKTGGVSLYNSVLWKAFDIDRIITNPEYTKFFEDVQRRCYLEEKSPGEIQYKLPDFDLMAVHTGYGIHRQFSEFEDSRYITIIRNPRTHIVSHLTTSWHMGQIHRLLPSEILNSNHLLFDNYQTRYLVEDGFYVKKITKEQTKKAIQNLKDFWVGTTVILNLFIIELSGKLYVST